MKKITKNFAYSILIMILFFSLLICTKISKANALYSIELWFNQMIPTLLPIMIIIGICTELNIETLIIKPFSILLKPIFKLSDYGLCALISGFIFGFPMGAKITATELKKGNISPKEAEYLLCFSNNLGPAYYLGFVAPSLCSQTPLYIGLSIIYGIPLLYGLILRYTIYANYIFECTMQTNKKSNEPNHKYFSIQDIIHAINHSIISGLSQIGILGGYMLFCSLFIVPFTAIIKLKNHADLLNTQIILKCIFEITSGLSTLKIASLNNCTIFIITHCALAFNGISCLFQTMFYIKELPISAKKYMLHKFILCSITCIVSILLTQFISL